MADDNKTVLVLGAQGGIGGEVARQLRDTGWQVRALRRGDVPASEPRDGMLWLRGDAMDAEGIALAARGCSVIVHAVNPPGYRRWGELVLPMLGHTLAAARGEGATVVLPGTLYNYGPDAFPTPDEDGPQNPPTRKGAIRVRMEQRLREETERGGMRALIVRAGDFFGPGARNNWFSQALVKPGRTVSRIALPGEPGVGHQWSYLPDVARTMVELLARREQLAPFARYHMGGHWDEDGTRMADTIRAAMVQHGARAPRVARFPWWLSRVGAPFSQTLREMGELRYLWRTPVRLDNARLLGLLGREPHTPWDEAVQTTLASLGCFPRSAERTVPG
ncbi:NAD-dependent epimerase/dehydratase family protein [Bordetella genomosp. 13]|uniref:NAD-dependent epimerase/dehydratase family protein n=1 Tax=Bordetella genomosp. 13 TaxID=463040 RepID=UPI0011A802B6|nr:NAD-dependent epimerase/dehydratase family protein [Bordetella genomosp. 13]